MELVLVRHGESVWNKENLFTGWTDVDLTEKGIKEAAEAGRVLKAEGFDFDVCYTSYLKRAIRTLNLALAEMDREWLPVIKDWRINERHYGALQGLNKSETAEKYGEAQVKIWRRSYDVSPPALEKNDERNPVFNDMYRKEDPKILPLTESLKDTVARAVPYYESKILPDMKNGKRVLVVAHGNSIRALAKHIEGISEKDIVELNIPTGTPLVYELDGNGRFIGKRFLGDADEIAAKMSGVAAQGKKK